MTGLEEFLSAKFGVRISEEISKWARDIDSRLLLTERGLSANPSKALQRELLGVVFLDRKEISFFNKVRAWLNFRVRRIYHRRLVMDVYFKHANELTLSMILAGPVSTKSVLVLESMAKKLNRSNIFIYGITGVPKTDDFVVFCDAVWDYIALSFTTVVKPEHAIYRWDHSLWGGEGHTPPETASIPGAFIFEEISDKEDVDSTGSWQTG